MGFWDKFRQGKLWISVPVDNKKLFYSLTDEFKERNYSFCENYTADEIFDFIKSIKKSTTKFIGDIIFGFINATEPNAELVFAFESDWENVKKAGEDENLFLWTWSENDILITNKILGGDSVLSNLFDKIFDKVRKKSDKELDNPATFAVIAKDILGDITGKDLLALATDKNITKDLELILEALEDKTEEKEDTSETKPDICHSCSCKDRDSKCATEPSDSCGDCSSHLISETRAEKSVNDMKIDLKQPKAVKCLGDHLDEYLDDGDFVIFYSDEIGPWNHLCDRVTIGVYIKSLQKIICQDGYSYCTATVGNDWFKCLAILYKECWNFEYAWKSFEHFIKNSKNMDSRIKVYNDTEDFFKMAEVLIERSTISSLSPLDECIAKIRNHIEDYCSDDYLAIFDIITKDIQ